MKGIILARGVLLEKLDGAVRSPSQNPHPFYDLTKKFDALFLTVAAGTVTLNIIYDGILMMVFSIMMTRV